MLALSFAFRTLQGEVHHALIGNPPWFAVGRCAMLSWLNCDRLLSPQESASTLETEPAVLA